MTKITFKRKKLNTKKLLAFGFERTDKGYSFQTDIVDGQMVFSMLIDDKLQAYTEITDSASGEEYVLHRVFEAWGSFVGRVKAEYEGILEEISEKCFDSEIFKSEQAKEIITYVRNKYDNELEYLWQKFPDNAVARRKDNQKWYLAILTVSRKKLGFDSNEPVEIIDLRVKPEQMDSLIDNVRYFPGYHMNKKHWITICLDKTVSIDEIFAMIDNSYMLAKK